MMDEWTVCFCFLENSQEAQQSSTVAPRDTIKPPTSRFVTEVKYKRLLSSFIFISLSLQIVNTRSLIIPSTSWKDMTTEEISNGEPPRNRRKINKCDYGSTRFKDRTGKQAISIIFVENNIEYDSKTLILIIVN